MIMVSRECPVDDQRETTDLTLTFDSHPGRCYHSHTAYIQAYLRDSRKVWERTEVPLELAKGRCDGHLQS